MATETTRVIQAFLRTIGEDIRLYRKLTEQLKVQKSLYLTFDATQLQQSIEQQQPLLEQLEQNANFRTQTMHKLGLTLDTNGVEKLFQALPNALSVQVSQQWQLLQTLVLQCQQLNHDNGVSSASFHELVGQLTQPTSHTYAEQL